MTLRLHHALTLAGLLALSSCARRTLVPLTVEYDSFPRAIAVPPPTPDQERVFNARVNAPFDSLTKEDGGVLRGYVTTNRKFFDEVMKPLIVPHLQELARMHPADMINTLTLFGHEIFRTHIGNEFYRWGGDIMDRDDPQEDGVRHEDAFGLDCSGFAAMPYDIAVAFGLLSPESESAMLASEGFKQYSAVHGITDRGGRGGTGNRCRLDTHDIEHLGRVLFTVPRGTVPSDEQVAQLQPGDLVSARGHVGIIVEINRMSCYLESGGWVVPRSGYLPCSAKEALALFARVAPLTIKRALPDVPRDR